MSLYDLVAVHKKLFPRVGKPNSIYDLVGMKRWIEYQKRKAKLC